MSYQNEIFSSKWELPSLPPSSLELWRKERARRHLSFLWKTLILIGHYGNVRPPHALLETKRKNFRTSARDLSGADGAEMIRRDYPWFLSERNKMHLLPKFFESHAGSNFNFSVAAATGKPLVQLDQAVNQLTPGSFGLVVFRRRTMRRVKYKSN